MKYNVSDPKLKIIIDELGEEYKDLLIERILDDAHETDADLINPSELIRLDVATKSKLRVDKKMQRQNRLYSTISLLGIMYALLGFMIMLLRQSRLTRNSLAPSKQNHSAGFSLQCPILGMSSQKWNTNN